MQLKKIQPEKKITNKLRVCAYARVSTDSDKQEISLDNQVLTYENLIKSNPEYSFAGVYADQGITGFSENRPELQRMLSDARAGKIDMIITKSISRFARNTVTLLKYVRELKDMGVGVLFEENNIYTLSSEGEMMLSVLASFAQEESRSMSENNKWTCRKKFERGELMINTTRFMGYDKGENGELIINEAEAVIVRRIFDMYLSGAGAHTIAKILNEEGITTVTGSAWHASTIMGMLRNEKYKGDCLLQKYYTPEHKRVSVKNKGQLKQYYVSDNHEAIIASEDWENVQQLIEYNRQKRGIKMGDTVYQNRYPNSHKMICPYCGKYFRRRLVYGKKVEWICATYIHKGKTACKGIRLKETELAGRVFTEPTVVEEVVIDGSKHYCYTSKTDYDNGIRATGLEEKEGCSVLPRVNRSRRAAIKL